jgi:hypothetical protein
VLKKDEEGLEGKIRCDMIPERQMKKEVREGD